jgi:hypothetical protein
MVNWREDIEFLYGVIVLVSAIITFFSFYEGGGIATASVMTVVVVLAEVFIGYVLFGSEAAVARWEKLEKREENGARSK